MQTESERSTKSNQSVEKAMRLIETLAKSVSPMTLKAVASEADMPAPTAVRFLGTLEDLGYVSRDPITKAYYLSTKFAYLGNRAQDQNSMLSLVHPILSRLCADCGESACLGVEQNGAIVYLDVVRSEENPNGQTARYIGNLAPMYCTGIGKVLLSAYDEDALCGYLNHTTLSRYTAKTIVYPDELRRELGMIRARGYAVDNEECELGKVCVAAPILNFSNRTIAAVSVTGPLERMDEARLEKIIPYVIDAAERASARLGYRG